ncbi:MAG: restriction endonuclease, partial [Parabacteroides sp.]|nr:restriction endonuclease [Parabacteroides sp.]
MFNYQNLESGQFEELCRDIMQVKTGKQLHVFAAGRDGGVDITDDSHFHNIVVQVKHYEKSSFSALKRSLTKEIDNVKKLAPKQYYVCVSQKLTDENVNTIYEMFSDYMESTSNIVTLNDIDDFLHDKNNIQITRKHTRLWMESGITSQLLIEAFPYIDKYDGINGFEAAIAAENKKDNNDDTKEDTNKRNLFRLIAIITIISGIAITIMAIMKSCSTETPDPGPDINKIPMNIDSYTHAVESSSGKKVVAKNYDDYDGDGKNEMFALVKNDDSINVDYGLVNGTLWFVNQYEVYALSDISKRYQTDMSTIKLGKNKFLNLTEFYDTGALSYLWGMKEGQPFEYNISTQPDGLKVNDYNEVETTGEDFSIEYDKRTGIGAGHAWITYYLYFDGNDFYEYGGKLISWDEFCRIPGIQDVLEK